MAKQLTGYPARNSWHGDAWPWLAALAGLVLFVFAAVALSGPGRIDIVDGQTRYEVARSLVDHGDSVIRDEDVWFAVLPGRDGQPHSTYRFPQTGLGVVAILAADTTGPVDESRRQFFFSLISPAACAFLALVYAVWFRQLGHGPAASLAWAAAGIFCTPSWYYGTSTFDDILGTAAVVPAVAAAVLWKERRPLLGAAVAGLMLGWAFNCKQPLAIFVFPVLAAAYRPDLALRKQWLPFALILLGLSLGAIACSAYDWYKFPAANAELAQLQATKYGPVWVRNPLPALANLSVSPSAGALWYCPTVLLSILGWRRWCGAYPWFCGSLLASSLGFTLFISFLTFFKGEPCWGPRYLTPVFALWWIFVPAAAAGMQRVILVAFLGLGLCVQLAALSVDPLRFFIRFSMPVNYYLWNPWLGFDPDASHLFRRPFEIREIVTAAEPAPEFTPALVPTYAPTLPSTYTLVVVSSLGHWVSPQPAEPLCGMAVMVSHPLQVVINDKEAIRRFQVFASLRPWWICQQHLSPSERPVALLPTVYLFGGMGLAGLALMLTCSRRPAGERRGLSPPSGPPG